MKVATWFFPIILLTSCDKDKKEIDADADLSALESLYATKAEEMINIRHPDNGWPDPLDCDGMIWAGDYGSSKGVEGVDVLSAEYSGQGGKFGRHPPPWCWENGPQGSRSTWSRDMAVAGLFPWALRTKSLAPLQRHAAYGEANKWQMGDPVDQPEVHYTAQVRSILYRLIRKLGGEEHPYSHLPLVWGSGLTDYEAHLQVKEIYLVGETDGFISETMRNRLDEHAAREPSCALFQALRGLYSGDMEPALGALLNGSTCSYIRCRHLPACQLAEWLFAATIVLEAG